MHPFKGFGGAVGLTALLLGATALAGGALAASPNENNQAHSLSVTETPFGAMPDGQKVEMYHLKNASGMEVDIITYGGAVQAIKVPDKNGKIEDVALGFDNLNGYLKTDTFFGALIGRYANRIAKGQFTLDGKTYHIPPNNGPNALHGGPHGFNQAIWTASTSKGQTSALSISPTPAPTAIRASPALCAVRVVYTLGDDNTFRIDYSATTDLAPPSSTSPTTLISISPAQATATVLDQVATINAAKITPIDSTLIPTGKMMDVAGTDLGFTTPTPIGARIHADNQQLKYAEPKQGGYDFNYVLNNPGDLNALAATVTDPKSGRTIEMYTNEPGVQFYTGELPQ